MKKILLAISGLLAFGVTTNSQAQITKLQDYTNYNSAAVGTYQGIAVREAGFSGLFPIPGTNGKEFWVCSDRGPNVDATSANPSSCRPTYDKIFPFPNYAPKIHRIRISGDSIQILRTISIKRPLVYGGTNATGLINPTGLGSTSLEVPSTDTVLDCLNFNLKTAAKDTFGIDCEAIAVDKDGYFWLSEEGGPTIWKLDQNGRLLKRYTPFANMPGLQSVDAAIDTAFKYRKNNRGFENLTIAPNGKIYAVIQSPLLYPTQTIGENSRIHRILEIDPTTNAMRMLVYLNDGIIGTGADQIRLRDWKLGDIAAINDSTFLILEAAARGATDIKRMYMININGATAVNSGLYSGVTLEALVDSAGLAANSIKPVKKTLFMDLLANQWPSVLDKAEGLAIINDSTIAICNDNDYGITSAPANGIITATGNACHLITYRLSGANKLSNFKPNALTLSQGVTGQSSSQDPYLTPTIPGAKFTSIITTGDAVGGYKMVGIPDGLGAFDNGNGTFTLVMNHELGNTSGIARAHGSQGAFVSKWVINKSDLSVVSGGDLMQKVNLWNTLTNSFISYNTSFPSTSAAFSRFCSADLPPVSAFYNSSTGLGTQERMFMNGEESGDEGRALAHIITGPNAGTTYELPWLGKFSHENSVASGATGDKTVVGGLDDATPGQVYFYIGTKTNTGTEIEKAGLTNGKLYGVSVTGLVTETSASVPTPNTAFSLIDLGSTQNMTGAALNTLSNTKGVTTFLRPEDGSWDPSSSSDFYFNTTNAFGSPSRLWKLHFTNIAQPELGGTITAVLDGTEGQQMLDNMGIDNYGHILLQEDVGNNAHVGKLWQYSIATDALVQVARHDTTRFLNGGANFLTQDEESSGIIDAQAILGPGMFLTVVQDHHSIPGELVEGGQLLAYFNPDSYNSSPEINVTGNSLTIPTGTNTVSVTNNTDFGSTYTGVAVTKTFVIQNQGAGNLNISAITFSGANAAQFSLLSAPSMPATVASGGSLTLTVQFLTTSAMTHNAMLNIASNDMDEATYSFALKATAAATPDINVTGNGLNILDGDNTPGTANNTDFGDVPKGNKLTKTFTLQNTGFGLLNITGINFTGANASEFTVQGATFPMSIAGSSSQTITVQFAPTGLGVRTAVMNIASNDSDEANYDFALQGNGLMNTGIDPLSSSSFARVYPNPTNTEVNVELTLTQAEKVKVQVYDVDGKEAVKAIEKDMNAGDQLITINTSDLVNGIYFVRVTAGSVSTKIKLAVAH